MRVNAPQRNKCNMRKPAFPMSGRAAEGGDRLKFKLAVVELLSWGETDAFWTQLVFACPGTVPHFFYAGFRFCEQGAAPNTGHRCAVPRAWSPTQIEAEAVDVTTLPNGNSQWITKRHLPSCASTQLTMKMIQ